MLYLWLDSTCLEISFANGSEFILCFNQRSAVPGKAFLFSRKAAGTRSSFQMQERGRNAFLISKERGRSSFLAPHSFFEQISILKISKKYRKFPNRSRGLYFFFRDFQCGLYTRAASKRERLLLSRF